MGLEDENCVPKKKLKQAQLPFANVAVKGQKRKLSPDLNDDVQSNKVVCKESGKENVEINNAALYSISDKQTKSKVDSITNNASDKHSTSINGSIIDLTDDADKTPQNAAEPVSNDVKTEEMNDFDLVISDSVLNTINTKNTVVEEDNKETNDKSLTDNLLNYDCDPCSEPDTSTAEEYSVNAHQSSIEEDLNKTLNSDDDDLCISSEDSSRNMTSPIAQNQKLTPKRLESLKKKEERERIKLERKALRAKVKEEKMKLKQEKEDLKRKEKEEKEKKRQLELKIKEEEKRQKEEERKKKEEEKKLKEEERRLKEEEKRRKEEAKEEEKKKKEEMSEKEKAAFVNFFIAKKKQLADSPTQKESEKIKFMPFPMKPDMKIAVEPRRNISCKEKGILDSVLSSSAQNSQTLYLKELKTGLHLPMKADATWPVLLQEEEHDVIIIESTENGDCIDLTNSKIVDNRKKMKPKLLQFHDNRRPPYWGTWRKKSKTVGPRKPVGQDKENFDYEVDSDLEWEDEVEGEDIDKEDKDGDSDEEQGEEEENSGENGYLLDNTFVPHGYLSDEEVHPDEDIDDNNPENLKLRMKFLKQEFDEEMESKTERLKPRLLGCVWISNGTSEISAGSLYETLMRYRAVWNEDGGSIDPSGPEIEESPTSILSTKSKPFPPTMVPVLTNFVHGNYMPLSALVREFLLLLEKDHPSENTTKRAVTLKIKEIASKTFDATGKSVWAVNPEMCKEYGLKSISNTNSNIISSPQPVIEKPKENLLVNFLKGTPPVVKKRVALTPVASPKSATIPNENETKYVSTPKPVDSVFKKRAQLITLPRTPKNSTSSYVHTDTPRPSNALSGSEKIDHPVDSPKKVIS